MLTIMRPTSLPNSVPFFDARFPARRRGISGKFGSERRTRAARGCKVSSQRIQSPDQVRIAVIQSMDVDIHNFDRS
jgi:hypothetical protein